MKLVILLIGTLVFLQAHSQDAMKPIGFVLQPSVGISIPLSSIQNGAITDNLISNMDTPSFYSQLSASYFWKHWGLGGSVVFNASNNPQNFVDDVRQYYSDRYYVNIDDYDHNYSLTNPVTKVLFGLSYKAEKKKLTFIYKLQIGVNRFHTWSNEAYLKEKNTNTIVTLDWKYSQMDHDRDFFCVNPSASIAYRFTNRIAVSFDIMIMHSIGSFEFYEVAEDIYTHKVKSQTFHYNNAITELNLGGSLVWLLHRNNKP